MNKILQLPYSREAEQTVLAAIMLDSDLFSEVSGEVKTEDFYIPENQAIFGAINELDKQGLPISPVTVHDSIVKAGQVGIDFSYISGLATNIFMPQSLESSIFVIKQNSSQRQLVKLCRRLSEETLSTQDINKLIEEAVLNIQSLSFSQSIDNTYLPDLLDDTLQEIERNCSKSGLAGISSGFNDLDQLTGGWQPGRYYVLGARPKMGKTSLFCQIASTAAAQVPTAIFSLEMTRRELTKLLLYQESRVDGELEQTGKLRDNHFDRIGRAISKLHKRMLWLDDRSRSMPHIIKSLRSIQKDCEKRKKGHIGLIVIDYIQLINGDKKLSRNYQLEEVSRSLKEISKDFNCCVLALAQVNRSVEERKDKRPLPSDLKDSGSFEQDADGLMLLYRDAYYNGPNEKNSIDYQFGDEKVIADITDLNMFLNRHGRPGNIKLDFLTSYRRFVGHGDDVNPFD